MSAVRASALWQVRRYVGQPEKSLCVLSTPDCVSREPPLTPFPPFNLMDSTQLEERLLWRGALPEWHGQLKNDTAVGNAWLQKALIF